MTTEAGIVREIRADLKTRIYVINEFGTITTLGFDVLQDRAERMLTELTGRGAISERTERGWIRKLKQHRGTPTAYDMYKGIQAALEQRCDREGDRAVYDLSPQLQGLEGWRVEVVDEDGEEPRRFIVGRSTGWAPCHLEISRRNAHGGGPARREYKSVRQIERVR